MPMQTEYQADKKHDIF